MKLTILTLALLTLTVHAESKLSIKPLDDGRVQIFVVSTVPWVLEWSPDARTWEALKRSQLETWNGTQNFVGEKNNAGFYRLRTWYDSKNGAKI